MDGDKALREQIAYLELQQQACRTRPELHHFQLAAYERLLAVAQKAPSAAAYYRAVAVSGAAIAVARAEWLDRYRNAAAIYRALGDREKLRAARICLDAAKGARTAGELSMRTAQEKGRAVSLHLAADSARRALRLLAVALTEWASECDVQRRSQHVGEIAVMWSLMRQADPQCTWAKVLMYPPYRSRLPFADAHISLMGTWLREALGPESLGDENAGTGTYAAAEDTSWSAEMASISEDTWLAGEDAGAEEAVPSAADVARPYRMAYAALDRGVPENRSMVAIYERIFAMEAAAASGPALLRMLAEENLLCQLVRAPYVQAAQAALAHCGPLSQPHADAHYHALIDALMHCPTTTAIEHEIEYRGECFAVESAWNDIVLRYAMRAVAAVMALPGQPGDAGLDTVRASDGLVCRVFGKDWDSMLASPRVWDFFCKAVFAKGQHAGSGDGSDGAYDGEVGLPLIQAAHRATLWYLIEEGQRLGMSGDDIVARAGRLAEEPAFATAEDMAAYFTRQYRRACPDGTGRAPLATELPLVLWGQPVYLDALMNTFSDPPRPAALHDEPAVT